MIHRLYKDSFGKGDSIMKIIGHIRLLAMLILAIPILIVTYRKHNGNVMVERNPPLEM